MTSLKIILVTICVCSVVLNVQSQSSQNSESTNSKQQKFSGLSDWFLSTGDWEKDPQLYVFEYGNGPDTIVMLHGGWGGEYSGLVNAVTELKEKYHFIFYDQRGSLRSPCPDSLVTFNNHIEDLEILRKELSVSKLAIIGHSMGAVLASAYATRYPQRIKQLVLLAPARLKYPMTEEDQILLQQAWEASQRFMERKEINNEMGKYNLNRQSPALSSREETMKYRINLAKLMLYDVSKWTGLHDGKAFYKGHLFPLVEATYPPSGWDYIQEFKKQQYPVSIIIGDHDFLDFKNPLIKKWASELPRIKLAIIEKAGHVLWLDQPEVFSKVLLSHIKGLQ